MDFDMFFGILIFDQKAKILHGPLHDGQFSKRSHFLNI